MDALSELLGVSAKLVELRKSVARLLSGHLEGRRLPPVLIQGETGSGKGLLASAMHRASARASAAFVDVNCAAIPEHLLEAEMFGFERGAFTDARRAKPGLFQVAHRGTIFLDEIGLLSTAFQAKLLKALEDKSVRRLGATRAEPADAWVICATNEDLAAAVRERRFRADLYHRVGVVTLVLPPLRERHGDILLLAKHFAERAGADYGLGPVTITGDAEAALTAYWWPGNVRELSNVIERAVVLADTPTLTAAHLDLPPGPTRRAPAPVAAPATPVPTGAATREHLERVLTATAWNITRAAAVLGISRNTMKSRMARLGLRESRPVATTGSGTRIAAVPTPFRAEAAPAVYWEPKRVTFLRLQVPTVGAVLDARPARLFELATDKLRSFGGRIAGLGPGTVLAVFGVERSDEPAVLAGHAALVIQKSARHLRHETGNAALRATIGLHVAEVLVGRGALEADVDADGSRREWIALETAMANAGVDEIVATKAAATFLHRRFAVSAVGPGSAFYRIDGLVRLDAAATHGGALVGRRVELDAVARATRSALDGAGGVVSLVGDAGIGKTRLLADLATHADLGGARYVEGRCLPATTQTPFWPVMQIVRSICRITEDDPEAFVEAKIGRTLDAIGLDDAVLAVDLARLLSSTTAPADVAADTLSRRLFAAVERLLTAVAARQPLVVVVEDLHWIDPSSESCLGAIVVSLPRASLAVVATFRPGYQPTWANAPHATQVTLSPLASADSLTLIRRLLGGAPWAETVERQIDVRAEGNPLFVEELALAAVERGDGSLPARIPATIEEAIASRLSTLPGRQQTLLARAAVIGRDFSVRLLKAIGDAGDEGLPEDLRRIERAGFVSASADDVVQARYTFKHGLVQETAYVALAREERRDLHVRVLDALEQLHRDRLADQVELLAYHAVRGDARERAIPYLVQAGQKASARSALVEALVHFDSALDMLRALPPGPDRDRRELELSLSRAGALRATRGFAAPEVGDACRRAVELCQRLGDEAQLLPTLNAVYSFHLQRAEYAAAGDAATRLLALAERRQDPTFEMIGHRAVGAVHFHTGHLADARTSLDRALTRYDVKEHAGLAARYGTDHAQVTSCFLGLAEWILGDVTHARERLEWAVAHGERLGHVHSIGLALSYLGIFLIAARELDAVADVAERLIALSDRASLTVLGCSGRFYLATARRPRTTATIAAMRKAADAWWATGTVGYRPFVEAVVAEADADVGDVDRGLAAIAEALAHLERSNERWIEAEVHRVHGALLAAVPGRAADAEACLSRAAEVARAQGARMWEVRATVAWARLVAVRDRTEARRRVEAVLRKFPVDVATPDLAAARSLSASLD
jgi:transcriptional regulator with AAA-type ATPase domain/predicted ATPase